MAHIPVLLAESIDGLDIQPGDIVLDATLGYGGHSSEICKRYGKTVSLYGTDLDDDAIQSAKQAVTKAGCEITVIKTNFRHAVDELAKIGVPKISKALFDLGISSPQLDSSGRGFTFQKDEPLVMTLETSPDSETPTAAFVVNEWSEEALANAIFAYGEEGFARKIAKEIVMTRKVKPLETTFELVECVKCAIPKRFQNPRINPATKTFQAIRIATNDELGALRDGLAKAVDALAPGGRIAIISFHSLEDRIVKVFIKEKEADGILKSTTKKPIAPSREEIISNPRSRSAKLRIAEKTL